MADIPNTTDGEDILDDSSGESFDSQTADDQDVDAGEADNDEGGEEDDQGDDGADDAEVADDGSEPAVRRDKSYFIGLRHGKKAAKAAQETQDDGDDEGGDLDDEDLQVLDSVVGKAVKPLADKLAQQEDAEALSSFMTENPAFKPYKAKIERFMKHDSRKHLPIETVAMEAVGIKELIRIGSKLGKQSSFKKQTSGPSTGGGNRGGAPKKSFSDMSEAEFAAAQQELRTKL